MNKHEVIEILWDELKAAAQYGFNYVGKNVAEQIYARIAPLREFPEEEFHALLLRFNGMDTASAWLDDCKRLWEGTDCGGKGNRRQLKRREGGCRRSLLNRRHHPETGIPLYGRWDDGWRCRGKERRKA